MRSTPACLRFRWRVGTKCYCRVALMVSTDVPELVGSAARLDGESVATSISCLRCVYVRRPVDPLQPPVRWSLCNSRTQYFARNIDGNKQLPPEGIIM